MQAGLYIGLLVLMQLLASADPSNGNEVFIFDEIMRYDNEDSKVDIIKDQEDIYTMDYKKGKRPLLKGLRSHPAEGLKPHFQDNSYHQHSIAESGLINHINGNYDVMAYHRLDAIEKVQMDNDKSNSNNSDDDERDEFVRLQDAMRNAKEAIIKTSSSSSDNKGSTTTDPSLRASTNSCVSWETNPYKPPADKAKIVLPGINQDARTCKVFMRWDKSWSVCSGVLVGPNIISLARHCSYSKCKGGTEPDETQVKCGYSYVASPLPYVQYDLYGTALVTSCIKHHAFDNSVQCVNGEDVSNSDLDIQICVLDKNVGRARGYFGALMETPTNVRIFGYPSADPALTKYYGANIGDQCFLHEETVDSSDDRNVYLDGAFIFAGESGSGYISGNSYVAAVHRGGSTGCQEVGVMWTTEILTALACLKREQTEGCIYQPGPDLGKYCDLVAYPVDYFTYFGNRKMFAVGDFKDKVSIKAGDYTRGYIAIYNTGTLDATITVNWYSSENNYITSTDSFVISQTHSIKANYVVQIQSPEIHVLWNGPRYIGATWTSSCGSVPENHVPSGIVVGEYCAPGCAWKLPTNNVCDPACNNAACNFDGGKCSSISPTPRKPTESPFTWSPTKMPSATKPSLKPTTKRPTTKKPTSKAPTKKPTKSPTASSGTAFPTSWSPTIKPTKLPSAAPTTRKPTTVAPTRKPTTKFPTRKPNATKSPTTKKPTTAFPTRKPKAN